MAEDRDAVLLRRMKTLVRELSQARMARATGRSRTSLTRYLQGAKLPLEFGVALVDEFGVNPNWLLAGEEPVYLADVPASSAELGNELLEMMRAMDNVSKLKLGVLSGKGHSRALREVTDMLDRYGSLRGRLNRMSVPILADLLQQAESAMHTGKLDRARSLEKVAARIERYCDDRDLSNRLVSLRAQLLHLDQMIEQATELRSHAFHAQLALDADFGLLAGPALGLAQSLHTNQYCARGLRVIRLASCYATDEDRTKPAYLRLLSQEVVVRVDLADFRQLGDAVEHLVEHSDEDTRLHANAAKLYYNLHHGVWHPGELAGAPPVSFSAAAMLLNVCYVTDDEETIERALKQAKTLFNPQIVLHRYHVGRAEDVLNALRGKGLPKQSVEERVAGRKAESYTFASAANRAHLLRLVGDSRAPEFMLKTQERLEEYSSEQTPLPVMIAMHVKNVLAGIPPGTRSRKLKTLREKAERMCRERIEQGFGLLRLLLD